MTSRMQPVINLNLKKFKERNIRIATTDPDTKYLILKIFQRKKHEYLEDIIHTMLLTSQRKASARNVEVLLNIFSR